MARQDVTVELPVGNAGETAKLLGKVAARNTALGASSPIKDDFNWADIATGITGLENMLKEATEADRKSQSLHYSALSQLGIAPNQNLQTPDTLYPMVAKARDILLVKNQTNPEALSLWGFNVVVNTDGGKRTVVVDMPTDSPEMFIQLCLDIVTQNTALGVDSPLANKLDMTFFETTANQAKTDFAEAEVQRGIKEAKHAEALTAAGYAPGQSSETPDTGYNLLCKIRDLLLVTYSNVPEDLTLWGFKVVVSATAIKQGDEPTPTPPPVP